MDSSTLITGLVTVLVGALSGGITNAVAVWMLFHPHEPSGFGPFRFHGAIPKNKPRLAKSVGKAVGERLLTSEDLARRLSDPALRKAFDDAVRRAVTDIMETERGPLRGLLSPPVLEAIESSLPRVSSGLAERLADYARSPAFEARVTEWMTKLREEVGDRSLGELLTAERRESLSRKVEDWVTQLAQGEELERTLRGFVRDQLDKLSHDDRAMLDRLPPGLIGAVEQGITDYLPVAVDRLSGILADPDARRKIQVSLRDAFDHTVRDLLIHERVLAKLMVTDRTIERLVDGFERRGLDRLAEGLHEPGVKSQVARAVNDAVVNFLRVPLAERFRRLGEDRVEGLAETLGDWLMRVARDEGTRRVIGQTVDRALTAAEQRTWGDLLEAIPPAQVAAFAADALGGERGRHWVEEAVRSVADHLLDRPIGRPAGWMGPEMTAKIEEAVTTAAWGWVQRQIPAVVEQFKVQEMVEQKVLGFSTQRMEQIVKDVTQRELDLIVRLGYVLGAVVGLVAFGVNVLLG